MKTLKFHKILAGLILLCASAAVSSCSAAGMIDASLSGPAMKAVAERHDAYVKADQSLTQEQRDAFLLESEIVIDTVNEANGDGAPESN